MGLFDNPEERERKEKLRILEDKRMAFLEEATRAGFHPEAMLLAAGEKSELIGLARQDGAYWLVIAPAFGAEGAYRLIKRDALAWDMEKHYVAPEGMGGVMGFGKKGELGIRLVIHLDDEDVVLPLIAGRNSALMCQRARSNPLLDPKRRRGDANVVWDLPPIDKRAMERLKGELEELLADER